MRSRNVLIGGLVAMLAMGSLALVAQGQVRAGDGGPYRVPVGSIGDEIVYAASVRTWQTPDGEPSDAVDNFTLRLTVDGVEPVADRAAVVRDTLAVSFQRDSDSMAAAGTEYVDLGSREIVQFDTHVPSFQWEARTFGPHVERYWDYHYSLGFFYLGSGSLSLPPVKSNLTYQWQGMALEEGQDLAGLRSSPAWRDYVEHGGAEHGITLDAYRFESRVAGQGVLDGAPVFAVEERLDLEYVRHVRDDLTPTLFIDQEWVDVHRTTVWLSEDNPYPVRIVRDYARHGDPTQRDPIRNVTVTLQQVSLTPGTEPIPWTDRGPDDQYRAANDDLERSVGRAGHPADGTNPRWSHGIGDATRSVQADPTLVAFSGWLDDHPDAAMVGADYFRDVPGEPAAGRDERAGVETWRLLYASPSAEGDDDQAFLVASTENETTGLVRNIEWGPATVPLGGQFDAGDLPENPTTLTAVDALWLRFAAEEAADRPPNHIHWGFVAYPPTSVVPNQYVACEPLECNRVTVRASPDWLRWVSVGFSTYAVEPAPTGPAPTEYQSDYHALTMDAETGLIWGVDALELSFPYTPNPAQIDFDSVAGPVETRGQAADAPVASFGPVSLLGVAGTSLVAAFLLAYFFPLIKYAAGSGFGLFPGYAKVGRDDVLENETRQAIHSLIEQDPGISPPEIFDQVNAGWSTVVYHLRVLEKNEFVSSLIDGRHKRFFPTDSVDWNERGKLAALKNDRTRQIYEMLEEEPGLAQQDISKRMEFTVPAAVWHLKRLQAAGLVGRDKDGRNYRYYANRATDARGSPEVA